MFIVIKQNDKQGDKAKKPGIQKRFAVKKQCYIESEYKIVNDETIKDKSEQIAQ